MKQKTDQDLTTTTDEVEETVYDSEEAESVSEPGPSTNMYCRREWIYVVVLFMKFHSFFSMCHKYTVSQLPIAPTS